MDTFAKICAAIVIGAATIFLIVSVIEAAAHTGEIDYCYIQEHNAGNLPYYVLYGHTPWRLDPTIASYRSPGEAVSMAKELNCPLGKK